MSVAPTAPLESRRSQSLSRDVLEQVRRFFINHCEPPSCQVPSAESDAPRDKSDEPSQLGRTLWTQEVDCMRLLDLCPELGKMLFVRTLELMDVLRAECTALCREAGHTIAPSDLSIRFTHLPTTGTVLPSLPPSQGQLVQVCGSVVRMTAKRVIPHVYRAMCPRCRGVVELYTSPFDRAAVLKPRCDNPACKGEEVQVVGQVWMDYAECRLQQRSNQSGQMPRSVLVTLDDELSTRCTVGQFVEVIGMLFPKWRHVYALSRATIEPAIWAIHVLPMEAYRGAAVVSGVAARQRRPNTTRGLAGGGKFSPDGFFLSFSKDKRRRGVALVRSVCPQLAGLWAPRMSILLSALGGACTTGKTSMHIRSTIHCLFVGDPSTGKSQLLRFAAAVAPRSTSTTGIGSTSAGLTVAATKEQGEWVLEPGALVLSDGGSCIIDELRTVSPADRAALHEAMEQQTISVAKGGLVTKLRTACAVLSACNPPASRHGQMEVGVGGPLLSRFDFIFLLWDSPQPAGDARIADHVLSCSIATHQPEPPLGVEEMARYLWWVRGQYANVDGPLLSDDAAKLLGRYYAIQCQRGVTPALNDAVPVTVRLLESLVRITQAHAKLHLQPVSTRDDAAMAILLMERSAHSLKCPLEVLGPDVYASSRELDAIFLGDDDDCVEKQDAVLAALVHTLQHYPLPDDHGGGGDTFVRRSATPPHDHHGARDDVGVGGLLQQLELTPLRTATDAASLLERRKPYLTHRARRSRESVGGVDTAVARLARDVSSPQSVARSCVRYHGDAYTPTRPEDVRRVLASQSASARRDAATTVPASSSVVAPCCTPESVNELEVSTGPETPLQSLENVSRAKRTRTADAIFIIFMVLPYTFTMNVSGACMALTGYSGRYDIFDKIGYVQWAQTGMGLLSDLIVVYGEKRRAFFIVCVIGTGIIYLVYYCKPSCFKTYNSFLGSYIFLNILIQCMYCTANGLVVETARKQTRRQDEGVARIGAVMSWMMMCRQIGTLLCDVIYYSIQHSVNNKQLVAITAGMYLFTIPIILLMPRTLFEASADDRSAVRRSKKLVTNLRRSLSRIEYRNEWVCAVAVIIYIFGINLLPAGSNAYMNAYYQTGPKWYGPTNACVYTFTQVVLMCAAGFLLEHLARKEFNGGYRLTTFMIFLVANIISVLSFVFAFVAITKYKNGGKAARDFYIFETLWRNGLNEVWILAQVIFFAEHAPKGFEAAVFETYSIAMSGGSKVQGKIEAVMYKNLNIGFTTDNVWKAILIGMALRFACIGPAYFLPDRRITSEMQAAGVITEKAVHGENSPATDNLYINSNHSGEKGNENTAKSEPYN